MPTMPGHVDRRISDPSPGSRSPPRQGSDRKVISGLLIVLTSSQEQVYSRTLRFAKGLLQIVAAGPPDPGPVAAWSAVYAAGIIFA